MEERQIGDHAYQQYLGEEKLMGSKCKECGAVSVPPRPICMKCHASAQEWFPFQGRGKLKAYTCILYGTPAMIAEGYDRKNPYCSGVVELEEGGRVDARIEGVDTKNPVSIKPGTAMKVKYLHRGEGEGRRTFLAFEPS